MPAQTLPTILKTDVESHNDKKSCYVTIGTKVFDVTSFIDDHPGGGDLILEYAGKDVSKIMQDEPSHVHSEAAYEILEDNLVGFMPTEAVVETAVKSDHPADVVPLPPSQEGKQELLSNGAADGVATRNEPLYPATGMSSVEDLEKETDITTDYKVHKFLDLDRPLLMQVFFGGFKKDFYLEQVHRPRYYKGGASAPLFGNFLEPISLTAWWVVPTVWLPPVLYGSYTAFMGLSGFPQFAAYWISGLCLWTLIEYILHRFLFHLDYYLPDNRFGITMHFLLHGVHHYLPMDKYRLVMPPALFFVLATPFWKLAHLVFFYNWYAGTAVFCGGIFGYICYDLTHYFLHFAQLPPIYRELKKYHLEHHFMDYQHGFGVTSKFWDWVFDTEIVDAKAAKAA